jgi:uncharacterized membrane protein
MELDSPQIMGAIGFALVMLVILLFILGLVWGLSLVGREKRKAPEEQLAGRFARGEISEGEYLRNLAILQHGSAFVLDTERELASLPREPRTADS